MEIPDDIIICIESALPVIIGDKHVAPGDCPLPDRDTPARIGGGAHENIIVDIGSRYRAGADTYRCLLSGFEGVVVDPV